MLAAGTYSIGTSADVTICTVGTVRPSQIPTSIRSVFIGFSQKARCLSPSFDSCLRFRLLSESNGGRAPFGCELNRLADGFKEATLIDFSGSCYIECSPVIDRCSHHRQTDGNVHA